MARNRGKAHSTSLFVERLLAKIDSLRGLTGQRFGFHDKVFIREIFEGLKFYVEITILQHYFPGKLICEQSVVKL